MKSKTAWRLSLKYLVIALLLTDSGQLVMATTNSRVALVFTNSTYSSFGELKNPLNDGDLVTNSLRKAGFEVRRKSNLSDSQMRAALRDFSRESKNFDVSLVYYAGHGVQISGRNYLLPIDLPLPESEQDVRLSAISIDDVIEALNSKYKIVVLDACRDNPILGRSLSRGRSGAFRQGLAATNPSAGESGGVFIAYSTQADAIASDGQGQFSPFAEAFARHLNYAGSVDDMFSLVTRDVLLSTRGVQRPFKYVSLDGRLCLTSSCDNDLTVEARRGSNMPMTDLEPTHRIRNVDPEGKGVIDLFTSLRGGNLQNRSQSEETLRSKLFSGFPEFVAYGFPASSADPVYSFKPGSVVYEKDTIKVVVASSPYTNRLPIERFDQVSEYSVDCLKRRMTTSRFNIGGSWSVPAVASAPVDLPRGSMGLNLLLSLCTAPENLTPLWVVDLLEARYLGKFGESDQIVDVLIYDDIRYENPIDPLEKYILTKFVLSRTGPRGESVEIKWIGVRCASDTFSLTGGFYLDANSSVLFTAGEERNWLPFREDSLVKPLKGLLCAE